MNTHAYLNHGRWVADCPEPYCGGAELASGGLFVCANCKRAATIIWPDDKELIDQITAARPIPETRNWLPGETLEDLRQENMVSN